MLDNCYHKTLSLECDGALTLLAETDSENPVELEVRPDQFERRKRRKIKKFYKDTKKLIRFEKAELRGNCCWKIWNRYRMGESVQLSQAGTFEPGWRISSVELLENCGNLL